MYTEVKIGTNFKTGTDLKVFTDFKACTKQKVAVHAGTNLKDSTIIETVKRLRN